MAKQDENQVEEPKVEEPKVEEPKVEEARGNSRNKSSKKTKYKVIAGTVSFNSDKGLKTYKKGDIFELTSEQFSKFNAKQNLKEI